MHTLLGLIKYQHYYSGVRSIFIFYHTQKVVYVCLQA